MRARWLALATMISLSVSPPDSTYLVLYKRGCWFGLGILIFLPASLQPLHITQSAWLPRTLYEILFHKIL